MSVVSGLAAEIYDTELGYETGLGRAGASY